MSIFASIKDKCCKFITKVLPIRIPNGMSVNGVSVDMSDEDISRLLEQPLSNITAMYELTPLAGGFELIEQIRAKTGVRYKLRSAVTGDVLTFSEKSFNQLFRKRRNE